MCESRPMRGLPVMIAAIMCLAVVVFAGETPPLESGARVRATVIDTAGGIIEYTEVSGRLVGLDESLLTMTVSNALMEIPRSNIAVVETQVQKGRKLRGTAIGLGIGGALGAVMGYSDGDDPPGMFSMDAGHKAAVGAVAFGVIGGLIGALAAPGEQWQEIPADRIQLGFGQGPDGASGLFLTRRF